MNVRKRLTIVLFDLGTTEAWWLPRRVSNAAWNQYRAAVIRAIDRTAS